MIVAAGVSKGVGISKAKLLIKKTNDIKKYNSLNADCEIAKLDYCIKAANDKLEMLNKDLKYHKNDPVAGIIDKYIRIINSRQLKNDLKEMIVDDGVSAEFAIVSILDISKQQLQKLDDEYLNERCEDIEEIKCRLLSELKDTASAEIRNINEECILVADDFTPGDVLSMDPKIIKGVISLWGGPTSSAALMARKMNIPAVTGIGHEGYYINEGDMLIVDGGRGKVIINPDSHVINSYVE